MSTFQETALLATAMWLALVAVRFRRSIPFLLLGLVAIGLYAIAAMLFREGTIAELGLAAPGSWLRTIGLASVWLGLMLAYSPLADWLASRIIAAPPTLEAFRAIQQSRGKLAAGIMVAWVLGAFLEELVLRGIVVKSVASWMTAWTVEPVAGGTGVCIAAFGAGLIHTYQGPRAVVIVTQLSVLFGVLFVVSGYDLWAVVLCHGLYDTIAFIRFATRRSKYSETGRHGSSPDKKT